MIQEGGYALHTLAACSDAFATGLLEEYGAGAHERAWSRHRYPTATRRMVSCDEGSLR